MSISTIRATNFKSFREIAIDLGAFNVLAGPNAAGKSNFISLFRFLRDIANIGLDNAISVQGGPEYLRNIKLGREADLTLELVFPTRFERRLSRPRERVQAATVRKVVYRLGLSFPPRSRGCRISEDSLTFHFDLGTSDQAQLPLAPQLGPTGSGSVTFSKQKNRIATTSSTPPGVDIQPDRLFPAVRAEELPPRSLLLEPAVYFLPHVDVDIPVYDFDSRLPKRATPISGKAELEEDGSNLALVLNAILANRKHRRELSNLVSDMLPFVEDIKVVRFADKSLLFNMKERFFGKFYLPASLLSDGTIMLTALIVALYFQDQPFMVFEEPERNIHPKLVGRLVSMMRDASQSRRILISTHNAELIRHAKLEELFLIKRDEDGFSVITNASSREDVGFFLEHEIGLDELFVQGHL